MMVNTSPIACVLPSMVTWRSSITSNKAACVFAGARFISSTSTMSANTGPGWKSNSDDFILNTVVPNTSLGIKSGVNCTREKRASISRASSRAVSVFATPGTPSISTCPPATMLVSSRSTASVCPTTICAMLSRSCCVFSAMRDRSVRCSSISSFYNIVIIFL